MTTTAVFRRPVDTTTMEQSSNEGGFCRARCCQGAEHVAPYHFYASHGIRSKPASQALALITTAHPPTDHICFAFDAGHEACLVLFTTQALQNEPRDLASSKPWSSLERARSQRKALACSHQRNIIATKVVFEDTFVRQYSSRTRRVPQQLSIGIS